jgi:HNH endonuclease
MPGGRPAKSLADRFEAMHIPEPMSGCFLWLGPLDEDGYGLIGGAPPGRTTLKAHRVAWEFSRGPIPEGLTIDHLCRNKACVNPIHLEPVTFGVNKKRALPFRIAPECCKNGHILAGNNLRITSAGYRQCRECDRRRAARSRGLDPNSLVSNKAKTHCPSGHLYSGENLGIQPNGSRYCMECKRQVTRNRRARLKAERTQ